jgi:hypothetical protein
MLVEPYGHSRGPGSQYPAVHLYVGPRVFRDSGPVETQEQYHLNPGPFGKGARGLEKGAPGAYVPGDEIRSAVPTGRGPAQDLYFGGYPEIKPFKISLLSHGPSASFPLSKSAKG